MIAETILTAIVYFSYSVIFIGLLAVCLSFLNKLKHSKYRMDETHRPFISFVVPAYNEELFIENTIKKYLETTYEEKLKEMIIVNDGSADSTAAIVMRYASKVIDADTEKSLAIRGRKGNITLINRKNGGNGKAYALNEGLKHAKGEICLITDADIEICPDMFEMGARHFADPNVAAVVGYARVKKMKGSVLNRFIDFEFFSTQELHRRGYNVLGIHYIIPGGMAFIRKDVIKRFGGYSARTLAEDTDLSFDILMNSGKEIRYEMKARVLSNEPVTLKGLWNQRVRWARGNIQVTWMHRNKIGKRRYGKAATIFYPFWLSNIIMPIAFFMGTSGLLASIISGTQIPYPTLVKDLLAFSFFGVWFLASAINRFRGWFEGLVMPGFPMLLGFASFLVFDEGPVGMFKYIGYPKIGNLIALVLSVWMFIAIPGTYLCLKISKRNEKLAQAIQLGVFGYWMFLVAAAMHGLAIQIMGTKNVWVKTEKR